MAIVGLGLMGGSLGLALKRDTICRQVVGLVRREDAVESALAAGIVDIATTDPAAALRQADIVFFATPVRTMLTQIKTFTPFYKPDAIITDMGSTKQDVVQVMNSLPLGLQPVGSHPMCGKEKSGMDVAEANLFENAPWIITPLDRTTPETIHTIQFLAEAIGSRVQILPADRHDQLVATISHLPHILAVTLVATALRVAEQDNTVWDVAATGFKDTSRVAAGSVDMWLDILLTNQTAVSQVLNIAQQQLSQIKAAISQGDEAVLRSILEAAAEQRRTMYQ
ncbi:MAG: prephenate dehydrogenase/arogenate dehydrogenase family protein [Anaerolineae bacterium]|nr:prephenate dehydrogenase/arogenate dehydrogenase family protein [Anaerolineae bacterium]MCB9106579.1 prephenate dehydrogenase/arogenate dehydrogenase family protein [Anaerolineales bacterium]